MADEQYRWLDRETAERLLSGESLEAVDVAARDRAERLAKTLDALSVEPPPTSAELPGEAAALAAFRTARAERADDRAGDRTGERAGERTASGRSRTRSADAGLVRIGGPGRGGPDPRRSRTVRLGLAAALTVGMVGGVAAAAGTGVLPTPFGGTAPEPAASVSAAVTPDRPLGTPSSRVAGSAPSSGGAAEPGRGVPRDTARAGSSPDTGGGTGPDGRPGRPGTHGSEALEACRDVRDGRGLAPDRRRALEGAAGGPAHVRKYCGNVLAGTSSPGDEAESGAESGAKGGTKGGATSGTADGSGSADNDDKADRDDDGGKGDKSGKSNEGDKSDKSDKVGDEAGGGGQGGQNGGRADAPHASGGPGNGT
ncbi:hypothetical protein ACWD0J_05700 [Streptomyces sp. NPDC003011]